MPEPTPGLYEQLVTERLRAKLDELARQLVKTSALESAEASDRIAWHVSNQIDQALRDVPDRDRVRVGVAVARALLDRLGEFAEIDADPGDRPIDATEVLHAIQRPNPDGTAAALDVPLIPLLDTTLLTNAPG